MPRNHRWLKVPQKWRDLASRAAWTGAQGAVSVITVEMFNLPRELIPMFAVGLSALKSWIATKVGNPGTVTFTEPPPEGPVPASLTSPQTLRSRARRGGFTDIQGPY